MILWSHIEELFLTFIFLIPKKKKKTSSEGLEF